MNEKPKIKTDFPIEGYAYKNGNGRLRMGQGRAIVQAVTQPTFEFFEWRTLGAEIDGVFHGGDAIAPINQWLHERRGREVESALRKAAMEF